MIVLFSECAHAILGVLGVLQTTMRCVSGTEKRSPGKDFVAFDFESSQMWRLTFLLAQRHLFFLYYSSTNILRNFSASKFTDRRTNNI